jgi:hypothetical protein
LAPPRPPLLSNTLNALFHLCWEISKSTSPHCVSVISMENESPETKQKECAKAQRNEEPTGF